MNRKSLARDLICSFVIALASSKVEAEEIPLKESFSGTAVNVQIDANGDGQKARFISGGTKGTLGRGTIQGMNELVFSGPASCPNGNAGIGFTLLRPLLPTAPAHYVQRFESTGDLLFFEQTVFTVCADLITQILFFSGTST